MKKVKKSGRHNPNWVMIGFLGAASEKAIGMLVSEAMGMNYKQMTLRLQQDAAQQLGILDAEGKVTPEFKNKFDFYRERVLIEKAKKQKKGAK